MFLPNRLLVHAAATKRSKCFVQLFNIIFRYDAKMMACSWDDTLSPTYNILLMIFAVILPLCIITFCYWKLFR